MPRGKQSSSPHTDSVRAEIIEYTSVAIYHGQGMVPVDNIQTLIYVPKGPTGESLALRCSAINTDANNLVRPGKPSMSCFAGSDAEAVYKTFLLEPRDYKPPRKITRRELHLPIDVVNDMYHVASPAIAEARLKKAIPRLIKTG
ncbi:MAG: hypothetical protein HY362_04205 [Candidatus Aenigmarchaeota archaeon]|nr:hypothetical protein [Candidatus Aenigmarchaeota archaeon]